MPMRAPAVVWVVDTCSSSVQLHRGGRRGDGAHGLMLVWRAGRSERGEDGRKDLRLHA